MASENKTMFVVWFTRDPNQYHIRPKTYVTKDAKGVHELTGVWPSSRTILVPWLCINKLPGFFVIEPLTPV